MSIRGDLARRRLLISGIVMVAFLTVAIWCLSMVFADACGTAIVTQLPSPDGRSKAVLFERNCGATTSFSSQISVLKPNEKSSGVGNAFVADADHGAAPTGSWGGPYVEMRWTGARDLLVSYDPRTRVFEHKSKVGDVAITYSTSLALTPPAQ